MNKFKLSRTTLSVVTLIALAGIGYGIYRYTHHSSAYVPDDPKNDAVLVHIVIAGFLVSVITAIQVYRQRKQLTNIWLAPFSQNALQRFKATMFAKPATSLSVVRAIACLPLLVIVLFEPFRMGEQIIGGLDQAATNNSWGGPSYAGSMAAHYMDALILLYVGAFILHLVMVKRVSSSRS